MGRPALWRRCVVNVCTFFVIALTVAVGAATIWLRIRNHDHPPPRFYAAIHNANLGPPSPDGVITFGLSLGVAAPPGPLLTGGGYCLERGTVVQVSYRGKSLACAVVAGWEAVCASWWRPPGNARWAKIVAHGNNSTTFPGFLAVNARRGVQVFDVSLQMAHGKTTAWCAARRVGGDDDKAAAACDVHYSIT